jgi:hypothetical protein
MVKASISELTHRAFGSGHLAGPSIFEIETCLSAPRYEDGTRAPSPPLLLRFYFLLLP